MENIFGTTVGRLYTERLYDRPEGAVFHSWLRTNSKENIPYFQNYKQFAWCMPYVKNIVDMFMKIK